MPINSARGEMYPFVDGTHNPIKGACWNILYGFGCRYCYVGIKDLGRGRYADKLRLYENELQEKYRPGKYYFIGSAADMWHPNVSDYDIGRVLSNCQMWINQTPASLDPPRFLFQTKNPERFTKFIGEIPAASTLATTVETDDMELYGDMSRAPSPIDRLAIMEEFAQRRFFKFMLSIEPIMKLKNLEKFAERLMQTPWDIVSIGADSCEVIPLEKQPRAEDVSELARLLDDADIPVVIKSNCANLIDHDRQEILDYWDACGWIYHRKTREEKKEEQGVLF